MTRQPDIALFLPTLDSDGGAERVMVDLAGAFVARRLNVDLVVAYAANGPVFEVPDGVRMVDLGASKTMFSPFALARYLKREQPRSLLATLDHANFVAVMARFLARSPTRVIVRQASTFSVHLQVTAAMLRPLEVALGRFFYPRADSVVCVSQGVLDDMAECRLASRQKLQVIYNPTVTDDVFARADEPASHPWLTADDGGAQTLLAVGSLTAPKDYPTLFRALALLRQGGSNTRLVILGEGPLRGMLEALRSELGLEDAVDMPGFDRNPFPYMAACDGYVLSSAWEGLPNVLLQAAALGAPVVATDCPSGPAEIIERLGTGYLVPVGDPVALSEAMGKALADGRRQPDGVGKAAAQVEPFTPDVVIPQYLQALGVAA